MNKRNSYTGCVLFITFLLTTLVTITIDFSFDVCRAEASSSIPSTQSSASSEMFAAAITDYYDGNFKRALTMLQELQEVENTNIIRIWQARCYQMIGDFSSALQLYNSVILHDSVSPALRLEYVELLLASNNNNAAREQLQKLEEDQEVLAPVLRNKYFEISKALENTNSSGLKTRIYLEQGLEWDSNAPLGPENELIDSTEGDRFILNKDRVENSDVVSETYLHAFFQYQPVTGTLSSWDTAAKFYFAKYFEFSEEDNIWLSLKSGPVWKKKRTLYRFPLDYSLRFYDYDLTYHQLSFTPEVEYELADDWIVGGYFQYRKKLYFDSDDEDFEADIYRLGAKASFKVVPGKAILLAEMRATFADKENSLFTYTGYIASLGIAYRINHKLTSRLFYKYRLRKYDEPRPSWLEDREDERNSLYLRVSWEFIESVFLNGDFSYTHNESNTDLYDYEQVTGGASISFIF